MFYKLIFNVLFIALPLTVVAQEQPCQWVTHQYRFMNSPEVIGKTFGMKGFSLSLGFNFAKFKTDKMILGICTDIKIVPGLLTIYPNKTFKADFQSNYVSAYPTLQDSANAAVVKSSLLGSSGLIGNTLFTIGLMFSPFPKKYGGLMLALKHGTHNAYSRHVYGNPNIQFGAYDKLPISFKSSFVELTCKPGTFFRKTDSDTKNAFINAISFSLYYERFNFKSGEFNGGKLSEMVSESFMTEYGIDHRFGFKFGLSFY